MNFIPKTCDEIAYERHERDYQRILVTGLYDFHVIRARELTTRRGVGHLRLTLLLHDPGDDGEGYNGNGSTERFLHDYLRPGDHERLWHFTHATDLEGCYDAGRLEAAQCEGRTGTLKLGILPGQLDGRGGRHRDTNRVDFYITDPSQVGIY